MPHLNYVLKVLNQVGLRIQGRRRGCLIEFALRVVVALNFRLNVPDPVLELGRLVIEGCEVVGLAPPRHLRIILAILFCNFLTSRDRLAFSVLIHLKKRLALKILKHLGRRWVSAAQMRATLPLL